MRAHGLGVPLLGIDAEGLLGFLDQPEALLRVENRERVRPPEELRVAPQQARTDRVEGPHPEPGGLAVQQMPDAGAHLAGRLVREGDREDPPERHAVLADEVHDPGGQNPCLAGARPGEHQDGSLEVRDGLSLLGIEGSQMGVVQWVRVRLGPRWGVGPGRWHLPRACPVARRARDGRPRRCAAKGRVRPPSLRSWW